VTDGIDAPLNAAKLSASNPILNRPPSNIHLQKLPATDNAVLSLSQLPDAVVNRTRRRFSMHDMGNRRFVDHAPMFAWRDARMVRRLSRKRNGKEAPIRRYRLWL